MSFAAGKLHNVSKPIVYKNVDDFVWNVLNFKSTQKNDKNAHVCFTD